MHTDVFRTHLEAVLNGAYEAKPLEVDGTVYGNRYVPKDGSEPLLTTFGGETLCGNTGLLKSVLLDRAYENEKPAHRTGHNSIYKVRTGAKDVAVKVFGQPELDYLEGTLRAGAMLKGWDNARIPEPYFAKGPVFAEEFVDAPSLGSLKEYAPREHDRVLAEFADSGLMGHMIQNNFNFGGYENDNVLVVRKNGGCEFVILDQGLSPIPSASI